MWGNKDPGVSVVLYFAVKPETVQAVVQGKDIPAIKLWQRFVTQHGSDPDTKRRFKAIAIAGNWSDLDLPSKLHSFNGKPVILNKCAFWHRSQDVLEVNVAVHKFGFVARELLRMFLDKTAKVHIKGSFLIQGESDNELPECVLGTVAVYNLKFEQAVHTSNLTLT
jgi:hypothetical protein